MAIEVEARILGVDVAALRARLEQAGATLHEDNLFRETLFALPSGNRAEYVRVRHDRRRVLITYKRRTDDLSRQEIEFGADDYNAAVELFDRIGLPRLMYREKHRTSYRLGDAIISIDRYPGLPAYVEVESTDPTRVQAACAAIGLDFGAHFAGGVGDVYRHYGIPLAPGAPLAFSEEERRRIMASLRGLDDG